MPITADEFFAQEREPVRRSLTADEFFNRTPAASTIGQTWAREDINNGDVDLANYMHQAAARIQEYQQARSDIGEDRLTANEQIAIVDAYRQMAGLQPEGYYLTKEGAAVPEDKFAELRRKRTEDDVWANFKSNISHTVLQNLAGIRAVQAKISDSLGITDNAIAEAARDSEEVTRILQPLGGKSGFAGQTVGNIMNLYLGRVGGFAATVGAPTMFAVSTAGSTFLDVAQRRTEGQEISPYTEWTSAIANATIEYALESFGQKIARRAGAKLAGRIGDIRSAVAGNSIRGGIRTAASVLVKHGFEQTGMALEGAAEEGITEVLQNTVRRLSYADEQDIFGGVGTAALQGAVMPLLAAGPMAAIQRGQAGQAGRPTPEGRAGLPPIPPSPAAGDQTLAENIGRGMVEVPAAKQMTTDEVINFIGTMETTPEILKSMIGKGPFVQVDVPLKTVDPGILRPEDVDPGKLETAQQALAAGKISPPIVAAQVGKGLMVADGAHRVLAAKEAGFTTISAIVPVAYAEAQGLTPKITDRLGEKQPWKMTEKEWGQGKGPFSYGETRLQEYGPAKLKQLYRWMLQDAIRSEKTLPDNLKRSLPAEADIPDVRVDRETSPLNLTDKWIGDRQLAQHKAGIEARSHQNDLKRQLREGEQLDQVDAAVAVYIDMKENSDSYTVENIQQLTPEQQAVIERAQSLSPDQQAFADQIIAENKALGIEAMEAGLIQNFRENYSARFWRKGDFPGRRKGKFTISTPRARQRTLPSLMEGWADGLELEVPGAIEAQMLAKQQISQVIHDRNLVALGLKSGMFNPARTDEHTHRVKHPNFVKWVWTGKAEGGKVYGKDVFLDPEGNLFKRAGMYASKENAKYLNNALGSSEIFSLPFIGEILKYNQILKHAVLTVSGFHYFAFTRSYMLASRGLNPATGYREGRDLVLGKKPGMDQLVRGGLTLGDQMGLDLAANREATRVGKLIDKIPMASTVRGSLIALSRANSRFLFNKFGTYLKANAAYLDYQHQLKKHADQIRNGKISEHDIAKQVATVYNADFGGLNLQRIGRNPTVQALHRAVSLAPDWTESNIRTMIGAFKRGDEGSVYRGMWGRVLMKGIGATVLANLLTGALDEEEDFLSQYKKAWERGNLRFLDVDITSVYRKFGGKSAGRKYLSIIGHFRDPIKFIVMPPRAAKGKMSMLARMGWEMGSGQDWRGRTFTSFGELAKSGQATKYKPFKSGPIGWGQVPSYIIKQAEQSTPVVVQALINRMRGELDTFDMITRSVGLPTVTTRPPKPKKRPRRTRRRRK